MLDVTSNNNDGAVTGASREATGMVGGAYGFDVKHGGIKGNNGGGWIDFFGYGEHHWRIKKPFEIENTGSFIWEDLSWGCV